VRKMLSIVVVAALAVSVGVAIGVAQDKKDGGAPAAKPKYTIKEVMQEAHKKGLLKTVLGGKATPDEKAKLLEYYVAMYEGKPKKGEPASWTKKSADALAAAAKLVVDPKANPAELKAAADCMGCHKEHK